MEWARNWENSKNTDLVLVDDASENANFSKYFFHDHLSHPSEHDYVKHYEWDIEFPPLI